MMNLYLFCFILSLLLTIVVRYVAIKKSLIDIPNERSSHSVPTPRGGGLAIAITWFIIITYLYNTNALEASLYSALMSGALLCLISFLDDIYTLPSLPRIIIHALVAAFALYQIGGVGSIDFGIITLPDSLWLNMIAFIGIIWFINLFNFIDGIDGYAASETIFVTLAFFFFTGENYLLMLAMAVLGFLFLNWEKAKIFMGDIGSTLLGFTVIVLSLYYNNTGKLELLNALILSALFWFDATYTLFRRYLNKEAIGQPHKKHAYQRIIQYGFSHQKTVLYGMFINLLLLGLCYFSRANAQYIFFFFCLAILMLIIIVKYINHKKPFN